MVAPLVGAWIEIADEYDYITGEKVAPLVGAWIEIPKSHNVTCLSWSLLSWERGLKWLNYRLHNSKRLSLLSWERGLKCFALQSFD